MYQNWSTNQGDYNNNNIDKYRKEELVNKRKTKIKKVIIAVAIYNAGFILSFLIIKWI